MVQELSNLKDLNFDEKAARLLIKPIIWGKEKLGLGFTQQKKNNEQEAKELHKKIIRKFDRRKVIVII